MREPELDDRTPYFTEEEQAELIKEMEERREEEREDIFKTLGEILNPKTINFNK
jgi:hypothetical protein